MKPILIDNMIYWIGLILIVISLSIIGTVIIRKFSRLSIIDVDSMAGAREAKIKEELIWQRVARKAKERGKPLIEVSSELKRGTGKFLEGLQSRAKELEKKYATERRVAKPVKVKPGTQDKTKNLLEEANRLFGEDSLKQAEEKFIEIISLDHHNVAAYWGLAQVYAKGKQFEEAKETLDFIIKLNKADDKVYSLLAEISYLEGDYKQSKEHLEKTININKSIASHHLDLAKVNVALEDRKSAQKCLLAAKKLEPKNPKTLDFFIENSIILGIKDQAKEAFKEFKKQNPDNPKLTEWKAKIDKLK
ncbi:tetratricopeptide repeat protein [Candidatus Saccharibacteria bacterium]|nr:tetratricopeptide repeat protein [Candidatus Saccharibacteria bacterium]NIV72195.1 tetratricopeptide repeat protein [Calditrichia bacterium]